MRKYALGRTMLEMLAVLAIIGILSIGGILAFQYAMNLYKANCTNEDVIVRSISVVVQDDRFYTRGPEHEFFFAVLKDKGREGRFYRMHTKGSDRSEYTHRVIVGEGDGLVSQGVCRKILAMQTSKTVAAIFVNDVKYEEDTNICLENGNQMTFYFNSLTGDSIATGSNGEGNNGEGNNNNNEDPECENKVMCYTGDCCNQYRAVCADADGGCPVCEPKEACGCTPTVCQSGDCCDEEVSACFYEGEDCEPCTPTSACEFCIYKYTWPSEPYTINHNDDGVAWMETKEVSYSQIAGCQTEGECCALKWRDKDKHCFTTAVINGYVYGKCISCANMDTRTVTCQSD